MSLSEQTTVQCPQCSNEQSYTYWQAVNVTLDPDLKEKLLDRTLVTFACEKCGHVAEVTHPLLYHDMKQRLMIFLGDEPPDDALPEGIADSLGADVEAGYTHRLVGSLNELIEKIRIWDTGIDDRLVEVFKLLLLEQAEDSLRGENPELFFGGVAHEGDTEAAMEFVLVNDEGTTGLSVPFEDTFREFEAEMSQALPDSACEPGEWIRVDQEYAWDVLESDAPDPEVDDPCE